MKITKKTNSIVESVALKEDEEAIQQKLDEVPDATGEPIDARTATTTEIAAKVQDSAADLGKGISATDAVEVAKDAQEATQLFNGKDLDLCTEPDDIREAMLDSLRACQSANRSGMTGDYPNILIIGMPGFGKTAIVKKFCEDYGLNMFAVNTMALDKATVAGIPYPVKGAHGELTQRPVISSFWDNIWKPNTVLFLDEFNRARSEIRDVMMPIINEHILPISMEDEDGKYKTEEFFPNILFTVACVNPAGDLFDDLDEMDPALRSRFQTQVEQRPSIREFLNYITTIYEAVLANPNLSEKDHNRWAGQYDMLKTILNYKGFKFDEENELRAIKLAHKHENPLNYRTLFSQMKVCNGTKDHFLHRIEHRSGFTQTVKDMLKNALATYVDKQTTGNNIWQNTSASPARQAKTQIEIENSIGDYINTLGL